MDLLITRRFSYPQGEVVNNSKLEVLNMEVYYLMVKHHVCSRNEVFSWALVNVYGVAQIELKHNFLAELARICGS